jgi:glycosyltransferase involved in cell wall biosynthesis
MEEKEIHLSRRVASDVDCIPGQQLIQYWRDRKIFEYGLRRADVIAVQSNYQARLLEKHYGLNGDIVNMALDAPQEDLDGERDIDVLWISNIKDVKRPDRSIALARRLPDVKFTMIGGVVQDEKPLYASIEQEAANMPNVDLLGQVPYDKVNEYVAKSKVFLNTSDIEGLPNTFLQAWARKVPVVAFLDPDGLIRSRSLGSRPGNESEMCEALRELLDDESARSRIGNKAHELALTQYSAVAAAKRYLALCGQ